MPPYAYFVGSRVGVGGLGNDVTLNSRSHNADRQTHSYIYRPRSVASEGYVFTGVCLSLCPSGGRGGGGGGGGTKCIMG